MAKLGEKIDPQRLSREVKPVILMMQPEGAVELRSPEELRQWEENAKALTGTAFPTPKGMRMLDTCSGGICDDCGMIAAL